MRSLKVMRFAYERQEFRLLWGPVQATERSWTST